MLHADSNRSDSSLETAFMKLVQEIEKEYRTLPKSMRIRIEKWLEKLVLTGSNLVWRKNRNSYARLLLDMVINKRLTEPFHQLPPDGPLPSFPSHVQQQKGRSRDLLGPHESMFWRELYHKMDDVAEKSQFYRGGFHSEHPPYSMMDHAHFSREINNLNLIVKEQKIKIDLLEQQLKEERSRHELELQRMHQVQRLELARVISKANSLASRYSPPSSPRRTNDISRPFSTSGMNYSAVNISPTSAAYPSTKVHQEDTSNSYYKSPHPFPPRPENEGTLHFSNMEDIYPNSVNISQMEFVHSSEDERKISFNNRHLSQQFHNNGAVSSSQDKKLQNLQDTDIFPTRISKDSFSSNPQLANGAFQTQSAASSTDEEFLEYLDGFQAQLKEAQMETGLTVAAIQETLSASSSVITSTSVSSPTVSAVQTSKLNLSINPQFPSDFGQEASFDPTHPQFSDATLMSPTRRSKETF